MEYVTRFINGSLQGFPWGGKDLTFFLSDIVDNFNDEVNENSGCEIIVSATLRSLGFVAFSPACDNGVADPAFFSPYSDPTIRIRLFKTSV